MTDLYNSLVTSLLPSHLSNTPEMQAFSKALQTQVRNLMELTERACIWTHLATLDDSTCDAVATQLRTPNYSQSYSIEARRALVAGTIAYYVRAGTPIALEEAVGAIFGNVEVNEWFGYGGKPYFFRVHIKDVAQMISPELLQKVKSAIYQTKRLTAWLEDIDITACPLETTLYFGGTLVPSYGQTVLPQWSPARTLRTSATTGGMLCSTMTTALPPLEVI